MNAKTTMPTPLSDSLIYAHTLETHCADEWELLYGENGHAERTLQYIKSFPSPFASEIDDISRLCLEILAKYHDMGKAAPEFQNYLKIGGNSVDHKTAAAKWILSKWKKGLGKMMALAFYAHHGGLKCGAHFMYSESFLSPIDSSVLDALPENMRNIPDEPFCQLVGKNVQQLDEAIFSLMMAIRMLHSCLIDADWLATEAFITPRAADARSKSPFLTIKEMSRMLEVYIRERENASTGLINSLRKVIHDSCYAAASKVAGAFRLNVPTGGGKTLSSLSFALAHALQHGMQRVIYVIPYTSIIEQTADEFRKVFGENSVVEHHCNLTEVNDTDSNRYATENWDAPLIVTTSVQFFETLFSNKNQRCRKIHNISHSVIVLDEAQTLPAAYLKPCLYALKSLQRDFGCSMVLCTATQPTVVNDASFDIGWRENEIESLISHQLEKRLISEMKRVEVENIGCIDLDVLLEHFVSSGDKSALFIVNLTRQAHDLFKKLADIFSDVVFHLSARMCPKHRADMLNTVRQRLNDGMPTILVATRVVEAGVDISFPVVYRDCCGLDSLAQAAGRCNRHGENSIGKVYYYESIDSEIPASFTDLRDGIYAMKDLMYQTEFSDILHPNTVEKYFKLFYNKRKRGCSNWDKKGVITDSTNIEAWDFAAIEQKFKLIEQEQINIVVPYGDDFEELRSELINLSKMNVMPNRKIFRKLSSYSVSVYKTEWRCLVEHCELVHEKAGIFFLVNKKVYDCYRGLLRASDVELDYVF